MKTYLDIYSTGYKHCACCKRWRPVSDFTVRKWADEPVCSVPRTLASICFTCGARKHRARHGYKPRIWYPHGVPGTERYRAHRRAMNRASMAKRMQDPEYRASYLEYQRIWWEAKYGRKRPLPPPTKGRRPSFNVQEDDREFVCADLFLEWATLVRPKMTDSEGRAIRRGTNPEEQQPTPGVEIGVIDAIMTRYGAVDQFNIFDEQGWPALDTVANVESAAAA